MNIFRLDIGKNVKNYLKLSHSDGFIGKLSPNIQVVLIFFIIKLFETWKEYRTFSNLFYKNYH